MEYSQVWVSAAMALYIIDLGVLHGFVRRTQKRYDELTRQVNGAPTRAETGLPGEVGELIRLEQRISIGWAVFDVVFLVSRSS